MTHKRKRKVKYYLIRRKEPGKMPRWVRTWDVQGDSGKTYRVSVSDEGIWGCSCWPWRKTREDCKHIFRKKAEISWDEDNISMAVRLKAELIAKYKSRGKSDEWIIEHLGDNKGIYP